MDDRRGGPHDGEKAGVDERRAVCVVLTEDAAFSARVVPLLAGSSWTVCEAGSVAVAARLADEADACSLVVDVRASTFRTREDVAALKRRFAGFTVACLGDGVDPRSEALADLGVAARVDAAALDRELAGHVARLAAIRDHRWRLEECEQGLRECTINKPARERTFRRSRAFVVLAVAIVLATAVAVPLIVRSITAARTSVEAGVDETSDTLDAIQRMEGYLQRDEERKVRRNP